MLPEEKKKKGPTELLTLRVQEISAVDNPANRRRFLIIKRAADPPCKYTDEQIARMVDRLQAEYRREHGTTDTTKRSDSMPMKSDLFNYSARVQAVAELDEAAQRGDSGIRARVEALVTTFIDVYMRLDPKLTPVDAELRVYKDFQRLEFLQIEHPVDVDPALQKAERDYEERVASLVSKSGLTRQACEALIWKRCERGQDDIIQRLNAAHDRAARRT